MVLMLKYYYHYYAYFLLINYSYLLAVLNRKLVLVLESSNVRIKFLTDFFSFLFTGGQMHLLSTLCANEPKAHLSVCSQSMK